jgi:hypothetical protein
MRATIYYRTFELRRRDKTTRIIEIFAGACPEIALFDRLECGRSQALDR